MPTPFARAESFTVGGLPSSRKRRVAVVPWASATPFTVRAMRAFISARTVASWVRIVPSSVTRSAMMLNRVPPWMRPMVRTRGWRPSICRDTMSWSAWMISAATGIGSRPMCGWGPVDGLARDLDGEGVGGGEDRPVGPSLAVRHPAAHVQAEDRLDLRVVESPFLHHERRPAFLALGCAFLGGLEEEDDGAGQASLERSQHLDRPEQDRRVRVVAAGVHDALHLALEREVVRLLDRQSVDVGPEGDDRSRLPAAEDPDDTRLRHRVAHLEPVGAQPLRDEPARALLAVAELRVGVQSPAHGHHGRRDTLGSGADLRVRGRGRSGRRGGEKGESQQHRVSSRVIPRDVPGDDELPMIRGAASTAP
jgi:hypothetical protein